MHTKHTPGPWRIAKPTKYRWELPECGILGEPTVTILGDDGYGVFCVPRSISDYGGPKHDANLQLIAAAPELLEALEHLLLTICDDYEMVPELTLHTWFSQIQPSLNSARSVIAKAKAKGEEL